MKKGIYHIIVLMLVGLMSTTAAAQRDDMGVPFFKNFAAKVYKAHNRNFDVLCDKEGHVFFANFEGLLVYDQAEWKVVHTPGISRIVDLELGKDGKIWFSGLNVKGYVDAVDGDSIRVVYTESDKDNTQVMSKQVQQKQEKVDRWNDVEVYQRLKINNDRTLLATATEGVVAIDAEEKLVWRLNTENGLCSNSITQLAYDGKGTVWGATDNGVFCLSVSEIYTHFSENEGLRGQIACIAKWQGKLMVGTFQGLFQLDGQRFRQVEGVNQACWQLVEGKEGALYAATSDGVYTYANGHATQLTTQFTLSILNMDDGSHLAGELECVSRYSSAGRQVIDNIKNILHFKKDKQGGVWAMAVTGEYYYMGAGKEHFERQKEGPISMLFEYADDEGRTWRSNDNGVGLVCAPSDKQLKQWLEPFASTNVQTMLLKDGIAWVGSNSELIRFDINQSHSSKAFVPQIYIRSFNLSHRDLSVTFSNDKAELIGHTLYSYRLHAKDEWSKWSEQQHFLFANLSYGDYELTVRSKDAFGQISESKPLHFNVPLPFYLRWYAILLYIVIIAYLIYLLFRYRTRRLRKEQQRLEAIVDARTKEVVKQKDEIEAQKDEIEEKSHKLEDTLQELRSTQNKLLKQEREAAMGKLTKGLIDRILNPMNYINNFSHLTLGFAKDLRENMEEDKENMTPDIYDDSMDVMDMMQTNLEKIEQHGISTTRILKAMEEMLKDQAGKVEPADVGQLCQQSIDMLKTYYEADIEAYHIQVEWQKPALPIVADVAADTLTKSITAMLANSIYALKKKMEKGSTEQPILRVDLFPSSGEEPPTITIYDNGIGIEESIIDKVFDPFFTTKPTAEAPGVGLYLSQKAIHDFGGNITVESKKNEYTQFTITLP
ncbi:MAG: hypothetical protein J5616_04490 [Bacteroidaceae bacterium]|nr:hypothetical protein [Bacteroidaceae bacterium]